MLVGASSESPERALSVDRMPQHDGALGRDDGHVLFTVIVDQVAHTLKHLVLGPHLEFNKKIISVFLLKYFGKLCHRDIKRESNCCTDHSFRINQQQVFLDTTLESCQHILAWRTLRFPDKEVSILNTDKIWSLSEI